MQAVDFQQFLGLARAGHNRIPLVRSLQADLDTPLSAYLKLAAAPNSFLLESVVGGERFGRYSFIGLPAQTRIEARDREICMKVAGAPDFVLKGDPLQFVEAYLSQFRVARVEGLPRFAGGLAGYFGHETIRYIEPRLNTPAAKARPDPMGLPDVLLLLTEELAVFDNLAGRLSLWVYAQSGDLLSGDQSPAPWPEARLRKSYEATMARLDALVAQLKAPFEPPVAQALAPTEICRDFEKADFLGAVARAKQLIAAGDVMQVVIGQLLRKSFKGSALSLYRALRGLNPSPYMYFYDMGDFQIAGASPEILVRQDEAASGATRVTIRPIAGTRPRGQTPAQDLALEQELRADPKECAEHLMLITSLAHTGLMGRIAQTGTVRSTSRW